jgi:GntR family transcriptional regulator
MRSIDTLSLSHATDEEAQLLDLQVDDPVIFLRSLVFDDRDDPFEYVISINHPYRVAFEAVTEIGNSGYGKEAA